MPEGRGDFFGFFVYRRLVSDGDGNAEEADLLSWFGCMLRSGGIVLAKMMVMLFVVRAAVVVSSLPFPSLPPLPPDQGAPVGIGVTERGSLAVQPAPNTDVVHHRGLLARRPRFEATAAKVSRVSRIRREVVEAPGCGSFERTAWRTRAHTSPSGPGRCGAKAPARIRASPSPPT